MRLMQCISKEDLEQSLLSPVVFSVFFGEAGIGKTASIMQFIKTNLHLQTWDYVFISSRNQLNEFPLSAIAMATGLFAEDTDYLQLYHNISCRTKVILHIENPDKLHRDALKLIDNALRYMLNVGDIQCKVILDYDVISLNSFALSCVTYNNTYIQKVSPVSDEYFEAYIKSNCKGAHDNLVRCIAIKLRGNFTRFNEMVLWLLAKGKTVSTSGGGVDFSNVTTDDIQCFENNTLEQQLADLSQEQYHVVSQASVVGKTVYSLLLQEALEIKNAKHILDLICETGKILHSFYNEDVFLPSDKNNMIYRFFEGTQEYVLAQVPSQQRYIAQKKLANYMELICYSSDNRRWISANHLLMLSNYFHGIDVNKELKYAQKAALAFEKKELPATAAALYWTCYTLDNLQQEFASSALKCWIDAEQFAEAKSHYESEIQHLASSDWSSYYYCIVLYRIGDVQMCHSVLSSILSNKPKDSTLRFKLYSLMASVYDWMNNAKKRKRYFLLARREISNLNVLDKDYAKALLWKKSTMCFSFSVPEVKKNMIKAYNIFIRKNRLYEAYECALNIGNEFLFDADFNNAYHYINMAYDGFHLIGSEQIYVANNSLGLWFMLSKQYENALCHYLKINTHIIEPFCAYSVKINIANAFLRLKRYNEAKEILDYLGKQTSIFQDPDMRIVATHYHLAKAFFYKVSNTQKALHELSTAMKLCDPCNSNFSLLEELCRLLLHKWNNRKYEQYTGQKLSVLCAEIEISICDIMCWR